MEYVILGMADILDDPFYCWGELIKIERAHVVVTLKKEKVYEPTDDKVIRIQEHFIKVLG